MRPGPRSSGRFPLLIVAPLVILGIAVVLMRINSTAHSSSHTPQSGSSGLSGAQPEQPVSWSGIARDHQALNAADAQTAYDTARKFVLGRLPVAEQATARFSAWPPSPTHSIQGAELTEIDRIAPYLWRVRGIVTWNRGKSPSKPMRERFESDLQHGPADDRWRLIDTEWLDPSWMPKEKDARDDDPDRAKQ